MTPLGDPVSEEVRAWLDHLPHLILRLAAKWLDQTQRETAYKDEWVPELTYIPKARFDWIGCSHYGKALPHDG